VGWNKDSYHRSISSRFIPLQPVKLPPAKFGPHARFIARHSDVLLIDFLVPAGIFHDTLTSSVPSGTQFISREMEVNLQALVKNSASILGVKGRSPELATGQV
jgi:hypothetical protein